ncbi:MAG: proprotein convertase P-domain-containing protein [Verrucomicrobia bacterium]|nr:proprotein convertase P-domain-containing protein [Verrucomicrobiota bacterium]
MFNFFIRGSLLALLVTSASFAPRADATTREYPGGFVNIVDNSNASPYPSFAIVYGITAPVMGVRVKMNLFHTYPDDVDVFLVAPNGHYAAVFSDAGDGADVFIDLVFDDTAATVIPDNSQMFAGTYRTVDYEPGEPAPPGGTVLRTNLTALAAGGVNGAWFLYVKDDAATDSGFITSWSMVIDTLPANMTTGRTSHTSTLLPDGKVLVAGGANGATSLASAESYDPLTAVWTPTGPLATGRSLHTATMLPNGKVLVAGGTPNGSTSLSSAELYDPATGTWSNTASMGTARINYSATLLPNGKVLVAGGRNGPAGNSGSYLSSAEIYDPATGTWSGTASMGTARDTHSATRLANGKVLVAGGFNLAPNELTSTELFDPAGNAGAGIWTSAAPLATASHDHTATMLPDGRVLVAGGSNSGGALTNAVLYSPDLNSWSGTAGLALARGFHTSTLLPNGSVMIAGGSQSGASSIAVYDPVAGTWSAPFGLGVGRSYHTATLLLDGQVLITGGQNTDSIAVSSTELFDGSSPGSWSSTPLPATPRSTHTSTLLPNGKVLVVGGTGTAASPEIYDPAGNSWSNTGLLGIQHSRHTATLLPNGKVLAVGGTDGAVQTSTELYDPALNTWSYAAPLATRRYDHTATLLPNSKVLVVAGRGTNAGAPALNSAELYDPAANTWSSAGSVGNARFGHSANLLPNGKVLVAGGYDGSSYAVFNKMYDPASNTWADAGVFQGQLHTATLLPNGTVLFAGGELGGPITNARVYHPSSGAWSNVASLVKATHSHTATLLPNGRVLVTGGNGASTNAQIYVPEMDRWYATGFMDRGRTNHTATLLPNGEVLVVGGAPFFPPAELYNVGLGITPAWRPGIVTASIDPSDKLELTGFQFRGISGASGGNGSQDSASDYPLVQWRRLDNGQTYFLTPDASEQFSATAFTSSPFVPAAGYAMVTVFVNGIPGVSYVMSSALYPSISEMVRSSPNILVTYSRLQTGLQYAQEQATDLDGPWTTNSTQTAPSESLITTNTPSTPTTFYRLRKTTP